MQGLHDGGAGRPGGRVGGGGDEREGVVEVHDLRRMVGDHLPKTRDGSPGPDRAERHPEAADSLDVIVTRDQLLDVVSVRPQQGRLGFEHDVFATRALISIVDEEDAHRV
jgi:hypothetical protein